MSKPEAITDDMRGAWAENVRTEPDEIVGRASRTVLIGFGVFVAWACIFPLGSAVVGEGSVVSRGQNKVIQHRTGGIIAEIFAKEGDTVTAGQPVVRLDPIVDQAELTKLRGRHAMLSAMQQRLDAEKQHTAGKASGKMPDFKLRGLSDHSTGDGSLHTGSIGKTSAEDHRLLVEQQREFEKGRGALLAEIEGLNNRRDALKQRRAGLSERLLNTGAQVASMSRQVEAMRPLANRGHIAMKPLWDIEEQLLGRKGELANLKAEEGANAKEILEISARIRQSEMTDQRTTSTRLTEVLAELNQISDQIRAAEFAVASSEVRASAEGTLIHTKYATIGAVVPAGDMLAQIVPKGSELAFRARLSPNDITYVKLGYPARATISALNARIFDQVEGEVSFVAADATLDDKTGQKYFDVEVRLTGNPKDAKGKPVLLPGMIGQVFIEGENRTFASYLLSPLRDSLSRAFREH